MKCKSESCETINLNLYLTHIVSSQNFNLLIVCNVGDSRAVVWRINKKSPPEEYGADSYKAIPLSRVFVLGEILA